MIDEKGAPAIVYLKKKKEKKIRFGDRKDGHTTGLSYNCHLFKI